MNIKIVLLLGLSLLGAAYFGLQIRSQDQTLPPSDKTSASDTETRARVIPVPKKNASTSISPKPFRFGEPREVLKNKLSLTLGRDAEYRLNVDKRVSPWQFICGYPIELDGKAFDYQSSKLKKQMDNNALENQFCALFKTRNTETEMVAFEFGSKDYYVSEWKKALKLPDELIP